MRKYEKIPVQWQTEGPLGSRLNEMPDEDFPNEQDDEGEL